MIDKLKSDNSVPHKVWERFDKAMESIPDSNKAVRKRSWKRYVAAAAAACVMCAGSTALAARVPMLGNIFDTIGDIVRFSGSFSGKAEVIEPLNHSGTLNEIGMSKKDSGVQVTASEIYCDGLSVFLTAQVETERGGFDNIPAHISAGGSAESETLYLRGEWRLAGESVYRPLYNNNLDGKAVDNHTFAGMLKLDLEGLEANNGVLELRLTRIGWDDITMSDSEDISESVKIDGEWNFDIPFSKDDKNSREIAVNAQNAGYTIRRVFVSPYQAVVYVDAPIQNVSKSISREGYEKKLGLNKGEESPKLSYKDYVALTEGQNSIEPYETIVCNQKGEILSVGDASPAKGRTTFAVNGKDITTLWIFVLAYTPDYENLLTPEGSINIDAISKKAVVSAEVRT